MRLFILSMVGIIFIAILISIGDSINQSLPRTNNFDPGAKSNTSGVGVAVADMNGDGYPDIISASPNGIKYFENNGNGGYFDRGVIARVDASSNSSGIGIAIADIDDNGIPDMIVSSPNTIEIFKNPVSQKK